MPTTQVRPENQNNMLQLIENFSLIHQSKPFHVCVQLGGHGGCFTDLNSPEMVRARETSELKIKTTTAPKKTENQMMMLQLMEKILFPIHPQRAMSSACSPWWSWWWICRL
jgi:hypothetical protein